MNVLFVLYHDFTSNSAVHVYHWANELDMLGVSSMVAVPDNKASLEVLGPARFLTREFSEFESGAVFPDGKGPDIVHAWTPRELVRRLCECLSAKHSFRQFVHLEDNEQQILAAVLGKSWKSITALPREELDAAVPQNLSHPVHARKFLESAAGITIIIDRLREFVPPGIPTLELWPSADASLFTARPVNRMLRERFGISPRTTVFAYPGNVHSANAVEVRSLYLAVAILNREGYPAALVRTGRDYCDFLGPNGSWGRKYEINVGYVPHKEIADVLAAADILVQPGKPDVFNDYRFPSKLPEFLALGRPVILPATNIGLHMAHLEDAYVLPKVDAVGIVEATIKIVSDPNLYTKLSLGSRAFFERRLSWQNGARDLVHFYAIHHAAA